MMKISMKIMNGLVELNWS